MSFSKWYWIILIVIMSRIASAQIFLRLDVPDEPESIQFYPNSEFEIKTKRLPNTWIKKKIVSFLPESNTIIFDQDFLTVDDITAIRVDNKTPRILGRTMQQFGTVWLGYGGVIAATGGEFSKTDAGIGLGAFASGWLIRKLGAYSVYDLDKGYKLRLIDIRFPLPDDGIDRP